MDVRSQYAHGNIERVPHCKRKDKQQKPENTPSAHYAHFIDDLTDDRA